MTLSSNRGYYTSNNRLRGKKLPPLKDNYAVKDSRVEYQLFSSEYFSGADVKIYFGDIWVDEITSLAYQLGEEVLPIYGYNSYTFDTVARGKRLIQGSFAINFTSVGYLQQVLNNANAIFFAIEEGEKKGLVQPSHYENLKLDEILAKLGKSSFEQVADEYEKAIWGTGNDDSKNLSYADRPYFRQDELGFDIRLQYGAVSETHTYDQINYYKRTNSEEPDLTVDIINGVQLTSMTKQNIATESAGAPIQEVYGFMARDINGVSFAHMKKALGGTNDSSIEDIETIYRKMQYGVIK